MVYLWKLWRRARRIKVNKQILAQNWITEREWVQDCHFTDTGQKGQCIIVGKQNGLGSRRVECVFKFDELWPIEQSTQWKNAKRWEHGLPDQGTRRTASKACFFVLGLESGATTSQIEAAFKTRAKFMHPDKGGSTELFQKLVQARDDALAFAA